MRLQRVLSKVFNSKLIDAESKKIFSFAKKHSLFDKFGFFNEDGLALVHLTDFAPIDGIIKSTKDAIGYTRNSVHFAVNHAVDSHTLGEWIFSNFAIIMPFAKTIKTKGNKIVGGVAADLYSRGSIRIPKGSVIVRYNSDIPKGKYKITYARKIQEFKKLKGVKIVETSNANMHDVTNDVIAKLGYKQKSTVFGTLWGKRYGENNGYIMFDKFNKLLRRHKMRPMFHSYTPNGRTERLLENLSLRAEHANTWIVNGKDGEIILNYKERYINILEDILEEAKEYNYKTEYDINKLIEIIMNSKTPKDAKLETLNFFNLKHLLIKSSGNINEYTLYQNLLNFDFNKETLVKIEEYLKSPCAKLEEQMHQLCTEDQLRYYSARHLFEIGADEVMVKAKNNEIANKLYKLA